MPRHEAMGPLDVADPGTMIGRQPELTRLRALWEDASSGTTRVVLVAGEPGVGKTRLAGELAEMVELTDGRVLVGRCREHGAAPYEPFVEALTPALAKRSDDWLQTQTQRHGPALARVFPDVASRLGRETAGEEVGPRTRFLSALSSAVVDLSRRPVLLVLEDLHWATASTVLLLSHLAHNQESAPLLVLATYRDAAIHPSHPFARFLDHPPAGRLDRIFLANLSPQAVTALLVDRAAVAGRGAAALADALWRTTEGNPLLLTEVLRDLVKSGDLSSGSVKAAAVDKVRIAHDVAEVVARRLGRTGSRARVAAEAAAVIGQTFSASEVAALTNQKEEDVHTAFGTTAADVVSPVAGRPERYRFVHDLVREAVYDFLPANRQVRLHHDLAEFLQQPENAASTTQAELVRHLAAATPVGRSAHAVCHAEGAGRAAMDLLAFEEAAGFFGRGLAFLGSGGSASTRTDLLLLLADAHHRAGESARARQSYLQATAVARADRDGPRLGRAVLGLGDVLGVWGADGLLVGLLDEALAANPDDASLRAKLLARLAQARATFESPDARKAQSDRAWELAWDSRDPDTMGAVLRSRHEALSAPDDLEDRLEIDGELFAMATAAKDAELALLAHGWRLVDLLEKGYLVDAERDRQLHAQLAGRSGDPRHQRDQAAWAAAFALLEGNLDAACEHVDRALALGQQIRDPRASSRYWLQQHSLLSEWGSPEEVEGLIEVWHDLVRTHEGEPLWRAMLALLFVRAGRMEEAVAALDDLAAYECADFPVDRDWLPTVAVLAEVAAALEDPRCALLSKLLGPYAPRLVVVGPGLVCRGSVSRVLGLLAAATGKWAEVERHFQAALTAHERAAAAPLLARTRSELGCTLARKSGGKLHAGRVAKMLEEAAAEADAAGMTRLAAETRSALERVGRKA
ncbi:MAG: AAA family ATPase [Actinomycetota bacterium]|nr:AAA family ATPase [Actinomycetota bacterium]